MRGNEGMILPVSLSLESPHAEESLVATARIKWRDALVVSANTVRFRNEAESSCARRGELVQQHFGFHRS